MMGVRRGSRSSDNLRRAECGYLRLCGRPRRRSQRQPNAPRANKQIGGRWSRPTPRRPKSLALSSTGSCPKSWFEKKNVEENQNIVNKTGKALKKQVEKNVLRSCTTQFTKKPLNAASSHELDLKRNPTLGTLFPVKEISISLDRSPSSFKSGACWLSYPSYS